MIKLGLVTTDYEFDALEAGWKKLVDNNAAISVFQSWEWQRTWWHYYGLNNHLQIIVAYVDNEIVGIFPLYIQKRKILRFLEIKQLRFIGTGGDTSPDDLGVLVNPDYEEDVLKLASKYLLQKLNDWDVTLLSELSSKDKFLDILKNVSINDGHKYNIKSHAIIQFIDLPSSWDDYLAAKSKKSRKAYRNMRNGFVKLDNFLFYSWEDRLGINMVYDKLIELHHKRWEGRAKQYSFRTNQYKDFHRDVITKLFDKDAVRLYCMEVNGEIMAIEYCYKWGNKIFNFQGGFDPVYEKKSPGKVIFNFIIEHAINEGNKIFDMLKGDYAYKKSLSNNERETMSVTIYQKNIKGILYRLRFYHISNIKMMLTRAGNISQ